MKIDKYSTEGRISDLGKLHHKVIELNSLLDKINATVSWIRQKIGGNDHQTKLQNTLTM